MTLIFISLIQMAIATALVYSCFCRLIRSDDRTHREIRLVIWFQAVAAGLVLGAPILPILDHTMHWPAWTTPVWIWFCLLFSSTLLQVVTAKYWRSGVPIDFQKDTA